VKRLLVRCGPAAAVVAMCLALAAPSSATPLPAVTGPLPVSASSYPFGAADHQLVPQDLAAAGYVEDEYLVSGTDNVYDWPETGPAVVRTPNAPYTTRSSCAGPASARSSAATSSSRCSTRRTSST
jgi:Alpha/beta hydrolase domain